MGKQASGSDREGWLLGAHFSTFPELWLLYPLVPAQGREGDVYQFTEGQIMKMIVLHPSIGNQKILRHPSFMYIRSESESRSVVSNPLWLYSPWNSPGQNTRVGSLSLLQGNLPNPGIEPRSPALQADSLPAEPQGKPKNTRVGNLSFFQQICPTQELNQGLLHCRRILYQLSYQGSTEVTFQSIQQWSYLWSPKAR